MCRIAVAVAAVVCACSGGAKTVCSSDAECGFGGFCDPELKSCLEKQCNPACPAWQICGSQGCVARYGEISVLEPAANGTVDGGVHVHAQLALAQNVVLRDDPATLDVLINGADGGLLTLGTLNATDAGDYVGNAYASYEGPATLVVQYRDATLKSAPVPLTFDQTAPVFAIEVPAPPARRDGGAIGEPNEIDPASGYGSAWKRNETVTLKITSTATDVDPASVLVSVGGFGGDAGVEGSPTTCTSGSGYCGQFTVDLSKPTLNAFHGDFPVLVTGADIAGNPASADGGVRVTRWNWAADAGGPIQLTPAVASDGTVMVANNASGVVALNPDGTTKWVAAPGGTISGGPAIGINDRIYVAAYTAIPADAGVVSLYSINGAGSPEYTCNRAASASVSQTLALAAVDTGAGGPETAVAVINPWSGPNAHLVEIRPDDRTNSCNQSKSAPKVYCSTSSTPCGAVSAHGGAFVYGDVNGSIQSWGLDGTASFVVNPGWPVDAGLNSEGLAISGSNIVAAGGGSPPPHGALFAMNDTGGAVSWMYPDAGTPSSPAHIPVIGPDNFVVVGTDAPELIGATVGATSGVAGSFSVAGAPAFGADSRLYAVTDSGELLVLNVASLAREWSEPGFGSVYTSTVLDCDRAGGAKRSGPGKLYVASTDGHVYSVIVDAHGIDTTAPWPMFQHDPRLTGNSATPLDPEFRCP